MFGRFLRAAQEQQVQPGQPGAPVEVPQDPVLLGAVDAARAAAVEEAGDAFVGEPLEAVMEADGLACHAFTCLNPAYAGWRWTVTLARVGDSADITVNEVLLLPGPDSILAPTWVPWSDRVRPGDLNVGDVLPTAPDDDRLVPGMLGLDDLEGLAGQAPLHPAQWELGLGRARILSASGQDAAVARWQRGETGPQSAMARHAALTCSSCGFLVTIGGPLGQAFGLCANAFGAADGRVVAMDYGCGAHSEISVDQSAAGQDPDAPAQQDQLHAELSGAPGA